MKIELIPAIDIIDGKCVRLTKGDYACKTIYNDNPVEVAKEFETMGFKRLHVVRLEVGDKSAQGVEIARIMRFAHRREEFAEAPATVALAERPGGREVRFADALSDFDSRCDSHIVCGGSDESKVLFDLRRLFRHMLL